jgi:hypothetical protein
VEKIELIKSTSRKIRQEARLPYKNELQLISEFQNELISSANRMITQNEDRKLPHRKLTDLERSKVALTFIKM